MPWQLRRRRSFLHTPRVPAFAALAAVALMACGDTTGPGQLPVQEELIVFLLPASAEPHEYDRDFFSVSPEGGEPTNLTGFAAQYYHPALSPDGSTLAFESNRGGCLNVWTLNARDGSGLVQLTGLAEAERCQLRPRWSPDGSMLAFTATDDLDAGKEVHVINADGTGRLNITNDPRQPDGTKAEDMADGWTPDGRVVVHSDRAGDMHWGLYAVEPDGSATTPLLDPAYWSPRWSPDGTRMAAWAWETGDVVLMDGDGGDPVVLTEGPGLASYETRGRPWSPDGARLAFTWEGDIWIVNADGTGLLNVTGNPEVDERFWDWSPDGLRILYGTDRDGTWDLYTLEVGGTEPVRVTNSEAGELWAGWVPAG